MVAFLVMECNNCFLPTENVLKPKHLKGKKKMY